MCGKKKKSFADNLIKESSEPNLKLFNNFPYY